MTTRSCIFSCFFGLFAAVLPASALAEGDARVEIVSAQFSDKVESGKPVGDGKGASLVTYWVEVKNPGEAASVVLVWSLDGKEAARQTLEVGRSPKWRTWGMATPRGAKKVEVSVLDQAGNELKKDVLDRAPAP